MKERTLILYHAHCPDGFGGAYAAWKKFGDGAEYLPVKHGNPPPEDLSGAHVYLIDFTYPKDIMDTIVTEATSVIVLDHHLGVKDVVESMPELFLMRNVREQLLRGNIFIQIQTPLCFLRI